MFEQGKSEGKSLLESLKISFRGAKRDFEIFVTLMRFIHRKQRFNAKSF